ncbi:11276_t:CDS:2 [Gigaspora margarita]|uniref:11276_t:CDS:1 n=1 Tax=Gigaspora margarita TaxID=4874 RepID=A0ABN7V3R9_GIGMA|nr:11276_t:CDS:2 [Gigaspora margarita]
MFTHMGKEIGISSIAEDDSPRDYFRKHRTEKSKNNSLEKYLTTPEENYFSMQSFLAISKLAEDASVDIWSSNSDNGGKFIGKTIKTIKESMSLWPFIKLFMVNPEIHSVKI